MAKNKAIYAPGELAKLRDNLGELDNDEAMRIARKLGGEVGYERTEDQEAARRQPKRVRNETMEVAIGSRRSFRRVELADDEEEKSSVKRISRREDPNDDPSKSLKANYWERVKMDRYMAQIEFAVKTSGQVLVSMLSFFGDPVDMVSPSFVNRRMNEYYRRIELMVTSVRTLLPRNNLKRNEQLKRISPFAFAILDAMRYWNIDQISGSLTRIQARPRNVKVQDLSDILREIYRPLYVLENLDPETHIKGAFKMLYKVLHLENPTDAKDKYHELIRSALVSYGIVRKDIRFQLYPLLMKLLSERFIPYELFFSMRKNRIRDFLQVTETSRISPNMENTAMAEDLAEEAKTDEESGEGQAAGEEQETAEGGENAGSENAEEPEEKAKKQYHESEKKALERGLFTLEALFPMAGWQNIQNYPDMYPYFSNVFKFKKGIELIAPTDPLQQAVVLMRTLEELFFGLRYAVFGAIAGSEGPEHIGEPMGKLINEWQKNIETSLDKEYMPRLDEYCRLLENKAESRTSSYAKRLLNELHWIKRLYFLPYYRFESIMPPPFQKNAIAAIYPGVRHIRRYLTAVASGIDQGNRQGGAEKRAPCDGIDNPWEPYVFQVPNPVSIRLDALLSPKKRNNASLIFFSLAVAVVLDHLLNNEDSWAYNEKNAFLFRSENGEGIRPLFGVDNKVDAEALFQQALKKRQAAAVQAARARANNG